MILIKDISHKSGFTLVELIVVISLIAIMSINSVFYFNDFIWKQELSYDLSQLENVINDLDKEINSQESFDYTLYFEKDSYGYSISQDTIWSDTLQQITFDTTTETWNVILIPSSWEIWEIKIYDWDKKINQLTKNWSESLELDIINDTSIISTLSWSTLNNLSLSYFDVDKETEIKNTFILDILDKDMSSHTELTIQNISWNKVYYSSTQTLESPIYVIFEKNWIESQLEFN